MSELSSLEKGLRILRELASSEHGMTAAELAQVTELNRTTVYRLSEILSRDGWVRRVGDGEETTQLDLGPAMQGLAILVNNKYDIDAQIQPIIKGLARSVSETVHVGVLDHDQIVHIAVAAPDVGMSIAARLGSRAYAHSTALGKALLATIDDDEVKSLYLEENLPVRTPTTIATVSALLAELAETRARGYALDNEESRAGVFCISAPVFDADARAVFAISVTTVPRQGEARRDEIVNAVQAAASLATMAFAGRDDEWRAKREQQSDGASRRRSRAALPKSG